MRLAQGVAKNRLIEDQPDLAVHKTERSGERA